MWSRLPFREIVLLDFEYSTKPKGREHEVEDGAELPDVACVVAWELRSGKRHRLWRDQLGAVPPYPVGDDVLYVAYYASAEVLCHLALGWPVPRRILDLQHEFRASRNGLDPKDAKYSLQDALRFHGLPQVEDKEAMRQMFIDRTWRTAEDRQAGLDYCEQDVQALYRLLPLLLPRIDLPRALFRGRYMAALAHVEHRGVPVDTKSLRQLLRHWDDVKLRMIADGDRHGLFDGTRLIERRLEDWVLANDIEWPQHEDSGRLVLKRDTFKDVRDRYAVLGQMELSQQIGQILDLRFNLAALRLNSFLVSEDSRNRFLSSAFGTITGRNTPSARRLLFSGAPKWMRMFVQPPPGHSLCYLDWKSQEFAIAAALSGDKEMQAAYLTGDPYTALARSVGAIPAGADEELLASIRDIFKIAALATLYGQRSYGLSRRLGMSQIEAHKILVGHAKTFKTFWQWIENLVDVAKLSGPIRTVDGWPLHYGDVVKDGTLLNFPMQGNGGAMLRLGTCLAVERGIRVVATLHDAALIEAPTAEIEDATQAMKACMQQAALETVEFPLGVDTHTVSSPDRYVDSKGKGTDMWNKVWQTLGGIEQEDAVQKISA
jgi:DNA polymerase I